VCLAKPDSTTARRFPMDGHQEARVQVAIPMTNLLSFTATVGDVLHVGGNTARGQAR
jgi:hypothetical protein